LERVTGASLRTYKIWLLKLIPPLRYGRSITGLLLLSVLLPVFYLGVDEDKSVSTPALFFSLIVAYIVPMFSFITEKSREALLELRPQLDMNDQDFENVCAELDSSSLTYSLLLFTSGVMLGMAHISFIRGSAVLMLNEMLTYMAAFISTLGAVLVWVVMTTVTITLIKQAMVFARLGGKQVRISLLNTRKLAPFARVAIISSLAIIGSLALFPLMSFDSELELAEVLPGAIPTAIMLLVIFIIPVWPLHQRLAELKALELGAMDDKIDACLALPGESDSSAAQLEQLVPLLNPLLNYRREIAQASTWPFDSGARGRLFLYPIIPPLTWAGAALTENLLELFIRG
jgi:hypothetical protein